MSGKTILIVDDDEDFRESLADLLRAEGYSVMGAVDGQDALDRLRAGAAATTGVILLDLMMPRLNGWQFRAEQVTDATLAEIPVVVLSADHTIASKAQAFKANGYVGKPVAFDRLVALLRRYCG